MTAADEAAALLAALRDARPYVRNAINPRLGGGHWRNVTARSILARVDATIAELESREPNPPAGSRRA